MTMEKDNFHLPAILFLGILINTHLYYLASDYKMGWKLFEMGLLTNGAALSFALFRGADYLDTLKRKTGWLAVFSLCAAQTVQYCILYFMFDVSLDTPELQAQWGVSIPKAAIKRDSSIFAALVFTFIPAAWLHWHCLKMSLLCRGKILAGLKIREIETAREVNDTDLFILCRRPENLRQQWRSMRVKLPASGYSYWFRGNRYKFSNREKAMVKADFPEVDPREFVIISAGPPSAETLAYLTRIIGLRYRARKALKAVLCLGFDSYQDCRNVILYPGLKIIREQGGRRRVF